MPVSIKNNDKIIVSVILVLLVNFLFAVKYLPRYFDFGAGLAFIMLAIQTAGFGVFMKQNSKFHNALTSDLASKLILFIGVFIVVLLMVITHLKIPTSSLNVDRYSVIENFLIALFNGDYPYLSKSNMGNYPGPMPFYFLIALPFNAIGELNLLSGLGYLLMMYLVYNSGSKLRNYFLLFLAGSFFLIWEIAVRSNVFIFSVLILMMMVHYQKIIDKNEIKNTWSSAVLAGVLLSTRSVFILGYIICYLSSLKLRQINFKSLLVYGVVAAGFFGLTFLPFFLYFPKEFLIMNPFIVQSSFLVPKGYVILFFAISFIFVLKIKNPKEIYFYSGLSLFIAIAIYFLYHVVNRGFTQAFNGSVVDVSYFIFCIPFLIYYCLTAQKSIQA